MPESLNACKQNNFCKVTLQLPSKNTKSVTYADIICARFYT